MRCGIKEVIRQRKKSGFGTNGAPDRDTLERSIGRSQMGSQSETPTGTLMRLYCSSAVPLKARIETGCATTTMVRGDDANADALQDV